MQVIFTIDRDVLTESSGKFAERTLLWNVALRCLKQEGKTQFPDTVLIS